MKNMLAVSAGIVHPSVMARRFLRNILSDVPDLEVEWTLRTEDLIRLEGARFDGVLLYLHRRVISDAALESLERFTRSGGGILALHCATASFKSRDRFFDILGGKFSGHGPVQQFTARPRGQGYFQETGPFTVRDELYHHHITGRVEVLYTALDETGEYPAAWTRNYGRGRVFYLVTGHRAKSMLNPGVRTLIQKAALWVCRRDT